MPELNLEEFPEDQRSAIQAEIDRRVTSAVQTTTKKVTEQVSAELSEKMQKDYEAKMQQAIADAQAQATMTEEQKIQALSRQLEEQKKAFERTQLEIKAQSKLLDAGLDKNAVEQLVPLIVAGADATSIDAQWEVCCS
jgi:maltodextrin utilization protein YvdJ